MREFHPKRGVSSAEACLDRHHMHRYDGHEKQEAELFAVGDVNAVLPEAIRYLVETANPIVNSWKPPQ